MTNPSSPSPLLPEVSAVIARVILEQTGRFVQPKPDELLKKHLDSLMLTSLALALQDRFDIVFDAHDLNLHTMRTTAVVTQLVERRRAGRGHKVSED